MTCHIDEDLTMEKRGREISLYVNEGILKSSPHIKLNCVACHTGFDPDELPHKEKIDPVNCYTCHKGTVTKHQFHPQMLNVKGRETSPDVNCKSCHGTHNVFSTKSQRFPFAKEKLTESCGKCHSESSKLFLHSAHETALMNKVKGAPDCMTCHATPITNKSTGRDSLQVKIAQEKLCLSCHLENPDTEKGLTPISAFIKAYENSVHGKALLGGNVNSAGCVDCHNSHDVIKSTDPKSSTYKLNVPGTCAKCHESIAKEYNESIHGKAVSAGNINSPVCTDCHGEHNILNVKDPNAPVSFRKLGTEVCAPCHSSVKLTERYGLSADKYKTFNDSYHGLALRGGSAVVANCASCHGVHNIKPSSDPTSTISKENLVATCGSCHPGANENFTKGAVHVTMSKEDEPLLYWIAFVYIVLIFSIVGGMLIHNTADLIKKARIKLLMRRGIIKRHTVGHSLYLRMTLSERIQHLSLMLSFFTLVVTGFMLRFPDAWWVRHIRDIIPDAFELRSLLHRIAAVVMIAASLYHTYYLIFTERGKRLFLDLLPKLQDAKDAWGVLKFNFGFSKEKPKFGRFSYIEKSEYWALVWGTIIMTATGFILWFENTFIGMFTKLGWDVARVIHYYEAWLAFLSILIWHVYFVIFNPDIYPMNLAWLKGTLTEEEMAEEHPLELEEIKKKQAER
jgi:cytochrome b subunit of formate dehydrogenase